MNRRHADRMGDDGCRATYAPNTVTNRTILVSPDGEQRKTLVRLGWTELLVEAGSVLLKAPDGFQFAGAET